MNNIVRTYSRLVSRIFYSFHLSIFITLMGAGLIFAVLTLVSIANNSQPQSDRNIEFNQSAIQELRDLHQSTDAKLPEQPSGRFNPFVE